MNGRDGRYPDRRGRGRAPGPDEAAPRPVRPRRLLPTAADEDFDDRPDGFTDDRQRRAGVRPFDPYDGPGDEPSHRYADDRPRDRRPEGRGDRLDRGHGRDRRPSEDDLVDEGFADDAFAEEAFSYEAHGEARSNRDPEPLPDPHGDFDGAHDVEPDRDRPRPPRSAPTRTDRSGRRRKKASRPRAKTEGARPWGAFLPWRRRPAKAAPVDAEGRPLPTFDADIVPPQLVAGSALVTVVAIMTFLACVMAGLATMVQGAASDWSGEVGRALTVEVRPAEGATMAERLAEVSRIVGGEPGVGSVRALSGEETEALLAPWLGLDVPLDALPVPRLVTVTIEDPAALDLDRLRAAVATVPGATLDDHRMWTDRLGGMANAVTLAVFVLMGLLLAALAFSVVFATRAAMASNAETIAVLHFVGAEAGFIAREFQRHFLLLGLRGAAVGGGVAVLGFFAIEIAGWQASATGSAAASQARALLGDVGVGPVGYVGVLGIVFLVALLTALTTRLAVHSRLARLG